MTKPRQTLTVIGPHGSDVTVPKPGLAWVATHIFVKWRDRRGEMVKRMRPSAHGDGLKPKSSSRFGGGTP